MSSRRHLVTLLGCLIAAGAMFALAPSSVAQTKPLAERKVELAYDSGLVHSQHKQRGAILSQEITSEDAAAPWIRLQFGEVTLGEPPVGGTPTILRLTSMQDNAVQTMNTLHVEQWSHTSAYFNGPGVRVEIIADPGAAPSRVVVNGAWLGEVDPNPTEISICGVDDRLPSNEPANARLMSVGCTAWIISDAANCFLTAGHCTTSSTSVVQFNVPLSSSNGTVQNPPPSDQYAVQTASVQFVNGGVGNDWKYFGCFPNSTTGLTPYQAQQAAYDLAAAAPPVNGQQIRITGYGTVSSPITPTWNQVQKTHAGPYLGVVLSPPRLQYQTDTTGGNSGSPVFDLSTGLCIGIHTHAGCSATAGNQGTPIHLAGIQNALANPLGVCFPQGFTIAVNPLSQSVCAPTPAVYTVDIGQVGGQTDMVTLSVNNLPAGATANFNVNPVTPGGSSVMTIVTANAAVGPAALQVVGTSTNFSHNKTVNLNVSNAAPGATTLVSPSNGAANVLAQPVLSWSAAAQATLYEVQLATDPAFTNTVYTANAATTSHAVTLSLASSTHYFWRVRSSNVCGTSDFSDTFTFKTAPLPELVHNFSLDSNPGWSMTGPTTNGWAWGVPCGCGTTTGRLLPSSGFTGANVYGYNLNGYYTNNMPEFSLTTHAINCSNLVGTQLRFQRWLGIESATFDHAKVQVSNNGTTWTTVWNHTGGSVNPTAWTAVTYDISSVADGQPTVFIRWVMGVTDGSVTYQGWNIDDVQVWGIPPACPADTNADSLVNVNDLLAVINAWGACPAPCPADVTGDGQVNVNDLLFVINAWGQCP